MISRADCSWRDTQLVPWLSALRSRDSAGPGEAALEAPKHHSGHSDPPAAPHAVWKGPGGPSLEPRVLTNPRGFQQPLVAEATGGYHPILLGLPVPGERSVLRLGSHSQTLGSLPASLWHVYAAAALLASSAQRRSPCLHPLSPSLSRSSEIDQGPCGKACSYSLQETVSESCWPWSLQSPRCLGVWWCVKEYLQWLICILWVELLNSLGRASGFPLTWFWLVSIQNWAPGPQRQSCVWVDADV